MSETKESIYDKFGQWRNPVIFTIAVITLGGLVVRGILGDIPERVEKTESVVVEIKEDIETVKKDIDAADARVDKLYLEVHNTNCWVKYLHHDDIARLQECELEL